MIVALYARVSTAKQSVDPQLADLRRYCDRMGWTIAGDYIDAGISGTRDSRPALNRLMGEAVLTILGALGKLERDAIAERVRLGQIRAREKGVRFGRPLRGFEKPREGARPKSVADPAEIARRRAAGQSWRAIARGLKVPLATVRRRMTACRKYPTEGELFTRHPVPTSSEGDQRVAT